MARILTIELPVSRKRVNLDLDAINAAVDFYVMWGGQATTLETKYSLMDMKRNLDESIKTENKAIIAKQEDEMLAENKRLADELLRDVENGGNGRGEVKHETSWIQERTSEDSPQVRSVEEGGGENIGSSKPRGERRGEAEKSAPEESLT